MRILFLTHYFHPEVGAPQTRILETAKLLLGRGHDVTVLTGFPNYPDGVIPEPYRGHIFQVERLDGLKVLRSAVYPAPNRGFARRLLNHASFALSSVAASTRAGGPDVVIAETPPLFTAAAAVVVARLKRAELLLNVADLWPESAVQLGALRQPALIRAAEAMERFSYRHARLIAVPTPGMRDILLERGYPEEKVLLLPNAVDVDRFSPVVEPPDVRRVLYCGTVGLAQGVGTLIEAARYLEQDGRPVEVLVAGDGAERERLEALVRSRGPGSVKFLGRVHRDDVPQLIASADVTAMTLRDLPLFKDAVPTKLLEYMAAGRPVVAGAKGQVARLLTDLDAGIPCAPEDPAALAEAIGRLASDPERTRRMGANGRRYVESHLSRSVIVERLAQALGSMGSADRESARIKGVYGAYEANVRRRRAWSGDNPGNMQILAALYDAVERALRSAGAFPGGEGHLLDVGCGRGELLASLIARGAEAENLHGADLLPDRIVEARRSLSGVDLRQADARALPFETGSFGAVTMSMLLSSIVDRAQRTAVIAESLRVLRPGGVMLCYDSRTPNPANGNVRAITRRELRRLLPDCQLEIHSLTLLPPLARRLGRASHVVYPALVRIPFLRTHLITEVRCKG